MLSIALWQLRNQLLWAMLKCVRESALQDNLCTLISELIAAESPARVVATDP